jgi:hypothetical protein
MKAATRIAKLTCGISAKSLISYSFDYLLYPFVIYRLGILTGGTIMMFLSLLACIILIKFYDWSKQDWLGIETIKGMKEYQGESRLGKLSAWILQLSEPLVFLSLTIKEDPFITMIYLRHGSHQYNGMSARDWRIFLASVAISNIYWTLAAYMGISVVEWVWKAISGGV